jgi:hypothetical protein
METVEASAGSGMSQTRSTRFNLLNFQESESLWGEGRGGIGRTAEFIGTDV